MADILQKSRPESAAVLHPWHQTYFALLVTQTMLEELLAFISACWRLARMEAADMDPADRPLALLQHNVHRACFMDQNL